MKTSFLIFSVSITSILLSSCASYLRTRSSGDARSGINVITSTTDSVIITLNKKNIPLSSKMIFDGGTYNSPYKVYKYYLPKMYKEADLNITAYNETKNVHITLQKDEGWFWLDGLVVWTYEGLTGKLGYYNDLNLSYLFKKD
jgi:hypothetical protein